MFWVRVLYAEEFVMGLCQGPRGVFAQPTISRVRIYLWLFIDLWKESGFPTFDVLACSFLSDWPSAMRGMGKN